MSLEMIDPKTHHQLFVDDYAIESTSGTSRTLHSPKKWGPLINGGGVQSRSNPQWNSDKKLWEWWYMGGVCRLPGRRALGAPDCAWF